ncbi:adenylate/guanylate cyclase domain-containing protein [Couchioplanes caeruleus]|uniref:Adenylate/guanylate cyclase family protein n=1 Tax=Couchioplanes caeruleus TaxID=56438 RepID=A0A3N1GNF9_9ACTN|nr:adenylate/guanylate cyclase domain-containing protein [Couchioplanes caeruleus]ROP31785.1 adenylate/guanylate cyclase family protein [Couchioplanes caeruleus]
MSGRAELPSGLVTFVFTDIEGSTRLARMLGETYRSVLNAHRELVRRALRNHSGIELFTEGDSFFVAFGDAAAAVAACVASQRALAAHPWPSQEAAPRVRMGLHTGWATPVGGEYTSTEVHRAARVAAAAHGGQILCSGATALATTEDADADADDVRPDLGETLAGLDLIDLGLHRLRGFDDAERLFQIVVPGLEHSFPPPRTAEAPSHNLPAPVTPFVGRQSEAAELRELVGSHRIVTVAGSGGCGKTRIALAVAEQVLPSYPEGIWVADLAEGRPETALAAAMGVRTEPGRPILESIVDRCRHGRMLLLLDTCDALPGEAKHFVRRLLTVCPRLDVLATSRAPLGLPGELVWRLPPMAPGDAYALLADRVVAARGGRPVADGEAADLGRVASKLDGHPLAVELAADRLRLVSADQLAARLDDPVAALDPGREVSDGRVPAAQALVEVALANQVLASHLLAIGGVGGAANGGMGGAAPGSRVLGGDAWCGGGPGDGAAVGGGFGREAVGLEAGGRTTLATRGFADMFAGGFSGGLGLVAAGFTVVDARDRHSSLTRNLDWSYRGLSPAAAALLRRLAVFAGPVELATVEWSGDDAFGALSELADRSLVEVVPGPRYRMSEQVKAYAARRLAAAGEERQARDRHVAWSLHTLDGVAVDTDGQPRTVSLTELSPYVKEWESALRWSVSDGDPRAGLRLAGALDPWWREHGGDREGRELLYRLYGSLESVRVPPADMASAYLVHAGLSADRDERTRFLGRAEAIARRAGDPSLLVRALAGHRVSLIEAGRNGEAEEICREVIARAERNGVPAAALSAIVALAELLWHRDALDEAAELLGGARLIEAGRPDERGRRTVDWLLGMVALRRGDLVAAHDHLVVALRSRLRHGFRGAAADAVAAIAVRCVQGDDPITGAVLFGGAESVRGARRAAQFGGFWSAQQAVLRRRLGDATFDAAYADGAEMGFTRAVAAALAVEHPDLEHGSARFAQTLS